MGVRLSGVLVVGRVQNFITIILLGFAFAYISIVIMEYGNALNIPKSMLDPMIKITPNYYTSIIEFLTWGIPLAITYLLFIGVMNFIKVKTNPLAYILLALPFFILHIGVFLFTFPDASLVFYLGSTLPKDILIILCILYFSKRARKKA